jgi:trans-aconitate methyltransferase
LIVTDDFGREILAGQKVDFIWAFSVFYHLQDHLLNQLFETAVKMLKKGGKLYANINSEVEESTWLEFPFNKRSPGFYQQHAETCGLKMTQIGTLESSGFKLATLEKDNILLMFELK